MAATFNLHRLFSTETGYLRELSVPERDRATLSAARETIRSATRAAFADPEKFVAKADLYESRNGMPSEARLPPPKFRLQGSFAYHTANDCQQTPPQQIDQDDGMFLPVGFVTNGGGPRPRITSKGYFDLVERALTPLCRREGWVLNPGKAKDSCVRVEINRRLHIDIPLFAIRDEAYRQLAETVVARADSAAFDKRASVAEEMSDDIYEALEESGMALATRTNGWINSDPRTLERWFGNAIKVHGPIVRRLARIFKGLRDAHWTECELGSICIMAAVIEAVGRVGRLEDARDDLAVLKVGREMVKVFGQSIYNPAFPDDHERCFCSGWSDDFRAEVQRVWSHACEELSAAIHQTLNKRVAIDHIRSGFGDRIPDDEGLVTLVGVADAIRKVEPVPVPKPMVPRTKSG